MLQPGTMKILQTTLILQSDGGLSNMKFTSLHLTTIRVNTNVLFAFDCRNMHDTAFTLQYFTLNH